MRIKVDFDQQAGLLALFSGPSHHLFGEDSKSKEE
jgi:hypothetical protein